MAPLALKSLPGRVLSTAAAVLVALLAQGASASAATTFTITGHGFGHGVGMSQFGAQGYAQHGATYDAILAHYYTGTHLGKTSASTIRVALQEARTGIRLRSTTGLTVVDEANRGTPIAIAPNSTLGVTGSAGAYSLATDTGGQLATGLVGPILVQPAGSDPVTLLGAAENGATDGTYAGVDPRDRRQGRPRRRERRAARRLRARRGPQRDAVLLAPGSARGPGGRRALVRRRDEQAGERPVRRLLRHAQPGLPRHRSAAAGDGRRRRSDRRPGRALRVDRRRHLLLVDLRRTHRRPAAGRSHHGAGALPRARGRSLRQHLAVPRLVGRRDGRGRRQGALLLGGDRRTERRRVPVRARPDAWSSTAARARSACPQGRSAQHSACARRGSRSRSRSRSHRQP